MLTRNFLALGSATLLALSGAGAAQAETFLECTRMVHRFRGDGVQDHFGWSSAAVSDLTGDGVQEVLVGAPFNDANGSSSGRVYLYNGRTGRRLQRHTGSRRGLFLGYSVREAGDVDGDGVPDIVAGGPGGGAVPGVAHVWSGATRAELHALSMGAPGDLFGYSVTGVPDLNGDGRAEVVVGSPGTGEVFVFSGTSGALLYTLVGDSAGDGFGSSVARVRDRTGDGHEELLVGAHDAGPQGRGRVYVFDVIQNVRLATFEPDDTGEDFGKGWVAEVGDTNGDGIADLYVGDAADSSDRGIAYLYDGATDKLMRRFRGRPGETFGTGRGAGDIDGDGYADLVLGGMMNSLGAGNAGRAVVFSGRDGSRLVSITGTSISGYLGFDAHGLGDVDGDGTVDYVVTATGNGARRGEVYVVSGRSPISAVGPGLAGAGGVVPDLEIGGCPELGAHLAVTIDGVRGAADGYLVVGQTVAAMPFFSGTLWPDPMHAVYHRVTGAGGTPGAGGITFDLALPFDAVFAGVSLVMQAVYLDPDAPAGVSTSDAVRFDLFPKP